MEVWLYFLTFKNGDVMSGVVTDKSGGGVIALDLAKDYAKGVVDSEIINISFSSPINVTNNSHGNLGSIYTSKKMLYK